MSAGLCKGACMGHWLFSQSEIWVWVTIIVVRGLRVKCVTEMLRTAAVAAACEQDT